MVTGRSAGYGAGEPDPNICPRCGNYWDTPQHHYACKQSLAPDTTLDGLPLYVPVERTDTLVRCQECGAVVEGDVVGQSQHNAWHRSLADQIERAGRWKPAPRYGGR